MSRTSLSDAAVLLVVAKVLETLVKYTLREKRFEIKDKKKIKTFYYYLPQLEDSLFLTLSIEVWISFRLFLPFSQGYIHIVFVSVLRVRVGSQTNEKGDGVTAAGVVCAVQRRAVH